jgi:hypothetical protein
LGIELDEMEPAETGEASVEDEDDAFEVWPEHWDAVRLFEACDTQWTVLVGFTGAHYQGLDMARVDVVRDWLGIDKSAQLLAQLRVMVDEAKKYLNNK